MSNKVLCNKPAYFSLNWIYFKQGDFMPNTNVDTI